VGNVPLDAVCLGAVVRELESAVAGAHIDKIFQPGRDEVLLLLRGGAGSVRILLCASPQSARIQLTGKNRENPMTPPMFCMLLRKHLVGGRIASVTQTPNERVVTLSVDGTDDFGEPVRRALVLEAMGPRSNLILLDGEGRVTDCLRRVDAEKNPERPVLPGLFYRLPPPQKKRDPFSLPETELALLFGAAPPEARVSDWLLATFGGVSPLLCRELAHRIGGDADCRFLLLEEARRTKAPQVFSGFLQDVRAGRFTPTLLARGGEPVDFTCFPIAQYGAETAVETLPSFSALLDRFYGERELRRRMAQRSADMRRTVSSLRDRAARKRAAQQKELEATYGRETLRQMGDLITSNLHAMSRGMAALVTGNYYDPAGAEVRIPLDPLKTPQQNAAAYYKRYNKAKNAERFLTAQLAEGETELSYLESVLDALTRAESERDLLEIRAELEAGGYLRRAAKASKRQKPPAAKPLEYRSSAGLRILAGRNNTENDRLTLKTARKDDVWFHVQKQHGAHVILCAEGQAPDRESMTEAARVAAYHSQARAGENVPVDYTPVRFVKKPAGAKPGMVVYTTYSTAYVHPSLPGGAGDPT